MIVNASPIIIFGKLNKLDILKKVFKKITIAKAVYDEVVENGIKINAPESLIVKDYIEKGYIDVKKLGKKWQEKANFFLKIYNQLDQGETETLALALQEKETVLIDERIARKIAKIHGIKARGSLWVLLEAFKQDIITEDQLKELMVEITSTKFRLSAEIINKFWFLFDKLKKNKNFRGKQKAFKE